MTTRECVHLVTGCYCRSRYKNGGHANRMAVDENPMLHVAHTLHCSVCYGGGVIGDGIFMLRGSRFLLERRFPFIIIIIIIIHEFSSRHKS